MLPELTEQCDCCGKLTDEGMTFDRETPVTTGAIVMCPSCVTDYAADERLGEELEEGTLNDVLFDHLKDYCDRGDKSDGCTDCWNQAHAKIEQRLADATALLRAVMKHPHVQAFLPYDTNDETFRAVSDFLKK